MVMERYDYNIKIPTSAANIMETSPISSVHTRLSMYSTLKTPSFDMLKKFIDVNKFVSVTYERDGQSLINKLNKVFPDLTKHFQSNRGSIKPIFPEMLQFEFDPSCIDPSNNCKMAFYIQTIVGDTFAFVETAKHAESIKMQPLYDVVMSDSYANIKLFDEYLTSMLMPETQRSFIYTWNQGRESWQQDHRKMYNKSIKDLVGLDDIYNNIKTDIAKYRKNKRHLMRLGESNGLNYMLYGPPGTGKSSIVRALAMDLGLPVYVCKMTCATSENIITDMLIPGNNNDNGSDDEDDTYIKKDNDDKIDINNIDLKKIKDFKIVLLEDFDRYLGSNKNSSTMSAILNALDGIFPSYGVIRFFSANNPSLLSQNKALVTRLNKAFYFAKPTVNLMEMQVHNAYKGKNINSKKMALFLEFIKDKDMSMRQLTHFLCQYIDSENPMDNIVINMEKWIGDMIAFSICKDSDKQNDSIIDNLINDQITEFKEVVANIGNNSERSGLTSLLLSSRYIKGLIYMITIYYLVQITLWLMSFVM